MDLLFKRYADPFCLLDGMIRTKRFFEFVLKLIEIHNNEKLYDLWLHKVIDKSFEEFKEACSVQPMSESEIETTVLESEEILNSFVPEG